MEKIKKFFQTADKFAAYCGCELLDVGKGTSKVQMKIQPHHLNGYGSVHGAAIFTLADFAFAAAGNSHGQIAVAINVSVNFVKAAKHGILTAVAAETSVSPKIGTYNIVVTDDTGDIVATFQCMAYRKNEPVPVK